MAAGLQISEHGNFTAKFLKRKSIAEKTSVSTRRTKK